MPTPTTSFSIFDGQEAVTYSSVASGTFDNVPAVRRPLTQSRQRNIERYIELQVTDIVLHLDGPPLAGAVLAAGDTIFDETSAVLSVLFVERQTLKNVVVAVCRPV
jgi:hypothetical protein